MGNTDSDRARRAHKKSRNGCIPCKKRHIRCDEFLPQCRNCSRRAAKCEYPVAVRGSVPSVSPPWVLEGVAFPIPDSSEFQTTALLAQPPSPYGLNATDLRLMNHLLFVSEKLETSGSSKMATWTNQISKFVGLSLSSEIVRHSLLALSAAHLGWITRSSELDNVAAWHQTAAYAKLQDAVEGFSRGTADMVLASTILLSWQAPEWRSWSALIKGENAIINGMRPWTSDSMFAHIIAGETMPLSLPPSTPLPNPTDRSRLDLCISTLHLSAPYMSTTPEHANLHKGLLTFTENLRNFPPGPTAAEQFKLLYPLRGWLFWMPTSFLEMDRKDVHTLLCFALFNATVLAVKPFFNQVGLVFYRETQRAAVLEIERYFSWLLAREIEKERAEDTFEEMRKRERLRGIVEGVEYAVKIATM